jgi:aminocarboxymuconate-semialdehyde decarboxylase
LSRGAAGDARPGREGALAEAEGLKRLYYDSVCYDVEALALAYRLAGPEHVRYGSDYPHNIGDMPGCAARIDALAVAPAEKELIRSGNARRLFKLDVGEGR